MDIAERTKTIRDKEWFAALNRDLQVLEVLVEKMRDKRFTILVRQEMFQKLDILVCDARIEDPFAPKGHGSIHMRLDTYNPVTMMLMVAELTQSPNVELSVENKREIWSSDGPHDRIRLDNKIGDRRPHYREGGDAMFSEDIFMDFILENEVLKIAIGEPFTLKSGRKSRWYVNWRTAASNAKLLNLLARMVVDFAIEKELQPHCFYGVKEGATKLGVITQMRWALAHAGIGTDDERVLNVPMGRGKAKEHGDPKDASFIGAPTGKVVILEDVTTTGGSLFAETRFIQEKLDDAEVIAAIGLTDRLQSDVPKMMMDEFGIPYYAMSQADRLLMRAFEKYECDEELRNEMIDDYNEFAIRKIEYTTNGE